MTKFLLLLLIVLNALSAESQMSVYEGHIDRYPIQLTMYHYSDGVTQAMYAYDNYDTPMTINGNLIVDDLILKELDDQDSVRATLEFYAFNSQSKALSGKWVNATDGKTLDIKLRKILEFDSYDSCEFQRIALIQPESTDKHYFKLLVSKEVDEPARAVGVRIYEKKTDKFIQEIELDCDFRGFGNIYVEDCNFDGILDFAVFETSFLGPNSSWIHVLYDPIKKEYFLSDYPRVALEFDPETQRVYEHNQCCAGRIHSNATYKVENNQLILLEQICIEYNVDLEDFEEVECDE